MKSKTEDKVELDLNQVANQIRQMKNAFKAFAEGEELINVIINSKVILSECEKKKDDVLKEIGDKEKDLELCLEKAKEQKKEETEKLEADFAKKQTDMEKQISELDRIIAEKIMQFDEIQTSYDAKKIEIEQEIRAKEEILGEKDEELTKLNKSIFEIKEKMKKVLG